MNANRTTCSACGLQFEATRRGARCPSCGTRSRAASGTLPPLPAGLQHHSTAVKPHHDYHFRTGLAAASVLFFIAGLLMVVTGTLDSSLWIIDIGTLLVASATGSALTTSFWQKDGQERFHRVVAESPFVLSGALTVIIVGGVLFAVVFACWRLAEESPVAVLVMLAVLVGLAYLTRIGRVVNMRTIHLDFHSVRTMVWQWWGPNMQDTPRQ